jgi:hypothetical protein
VQLYVLGSRIPIVSVFIRVTASKEGKEKGRKGKGKGRENNSHFTDKEMATQAFPSHKASKLSQVRLNSGLWCCKAHAGLPYHVVEYLQLRLK